MPPLSQSDRLEADQIQERVRAKFCPNWREQLLRHKASLGGKVRDARAFIRKKHRGFRRVQNL